MSSHLPELNNKAFIFLFFFKKKYVFLKQHANFDVDLE